MLKNISTVIIAVLAGVAIVACDRADRESRESHSEVQERLLKIKCNNPLSFDAQALIEARNSDPSLRDNPNIMLTNTIVTDDRLVVRTVKDVTASNDKYQLDETGDLAKATFKMSMKEARDFGSKNSMYVEKNCDNLTALFTINDLGISTKAEITDITLNSITLEASNKQILIEEVLPEEDEASAVKLTGTNVHTIRVTISAEQVDGSVNQTVYESSLEVL